MTTPKSSNAAGFVAVVMAKRPGLGEVKSRLCAGRDAFDPAAVVELAWAMTLCTIERIAQHWPVIIAGSPDGAAGEIIGRLDNRRLRHRIGPIEQGPGDLGQRLARVWAAVGRDQPVGFFGADSPDLPAALLEQVPATLHTCDVAAGPTLDGGYWCLAARRSCPQVLEDIDWGTGQVYDQTCRRAAASGLSFRDLPLWYDVDHPADLLALQGRLRRRLASHDPFVADDDPLPRLLAVIDKVCAAGEPALDHP